MSILTMYPPHNHWGALTVTGITEKWREVQISDGLTEEVRDYRLYMRCDCGKTVEMFKSEFPGKKEMRDCGCGVGNSRRGVSQIKSFYVSDQLCEQIQVYALKNKLTFSAAVSELVAVGLEAMRES
ncbi:MAG TPA: hypothetical protein VF077_04010 [Nitrospiraceae bacterium]